ncbi:MAG: hypothetical protein O2798_00145 [Chloroflexi bacterium]|nr:hypothetical protein [Chloroflexota bacterium]MDA1239233.1 hypothetical protein [Chloroflexota bacterium]
MNFVLLDYDRNDDRSLAQRLGVGQHPAFAVVAPDSDNVTQRLFGPQTDANLREVLDGAAAGGS